MMMLVCFCMEDVKHMCWLRMQVFQLDTEPAVPHRLITSPAATLPIPI